MLRTLFITSASDSSGYRSEPTYGVKTPKAGEYAGKAEFVQAHDLAVHVALDEKEAKELVDAVSATLTKIVNRRVKAGVTYQSEPQTPKK